MGLTGPYWALLGLTGPYWALLGLAGPCWALIGLTLHLSTNARTDGRTKVHYDLLGCFRSQKQDELD